MPPVCQRTPCRLLGKGFFDKGSNMMQEVMRIPMAIARVGQIARGQKSDAIACSNNINVTLLDLAIPGKNDKPWRDILMCETYGHGYGTTIMGRMLFTAAINMSAPKTTSTSFAI